MSLFNIVMRSNLISKGCKLYYTYLVNLTKISKVNNWKITDGKYKNYNFCIPTDIYVSKKLNMGLTSIYKYKKTLKSLGLIDILTKCTTKTNQRRNYHNRQLTVVLKAMPRKLISKLLVYIRKARILKTSNIIISQVKQSLNNTVRNIHTKVKKLLNTVKHTNYKNIANNNNLNLNKEDVQTVCNTLNTYRINFKNYEIKSYVDLYNKSKEKFTQTCKYCSDKENIYAPLKYFTKVFESSKAYINKFCDFTQREYSDTFFDSLIDN